VTGGCRHVVAPTAVVGVSTVIVVHLSDCLEVH